MNASRWSTIWLYFAAMVGWRAVLLSMTVVELGCGPARSTGEPRAPELRESPVSAEAYDPVLEEPGPTQPPAYMQGRRPVVRVGPYQYLFSHNDELAKGGSLHDAVLDATIVVDGPETDRLPLRDYLKGGVMPQKWGPGTKAEDDPGSWFDRYRLPLGRYHKLGRYRVSLQADPRLELRITPSEFDIVPAPPAPVIDLPRERLSERYRTSRVAAARGALGTFIAVEDGSGIRIDTPARRARAHIKQGSAPNKWGPALAASPQGLAIGYLDGAAVRLALFNRSLAPVRTIHLGTTNLEWWLSTPMPMRVLWNPNAGEWTVSWSQSEALSAAQARVLGESGEDSDAGEYTVTHFARVSPLGKVRQSVRLAAGYLADMVRTGSSHAVLIHEPGSLGLITVEGRRIRRGPQAASAVGVPELGKSETPVIITPSGSGYDAVFRNPLFDIDGNASLTPALQAVALDGRGHPTAPARAVLIHPITMSFDLRTHGGRVWLAYAIADMETERGLVLVAPLGPDSLPEAAFIVDSDYDLVHAVRFVGEGDDFSLAVIRDAESFIVDLTPLLAPDAGPRVLPPDPNRVLDAVKKRSPWGP